MYGYIFTSQLYLICARSDPDYSAQEWVFQLVNLLPVWKMGYFGKGIRVRVNDDGVNASHPEFIGRFDFNGSCATNTIYPVQTNTTTWEPFHGTAVAGILGANANNNECSVGVAPQVTLSACNVYLSVTESFLETKLDAFDISQNSWGFPACNGRRTRDLQGSNNAILTNVPTATPTVQGTCPFHYKGATLVPSPCGVCSFGAAAIRTHTCDTTIVNYCSVYYQYDVQGCLDFLNLLLPTGQCDFNTLSPAAQIALNNGILHGRNGKGIIFVFASGNSYMYGDNTNYAGFTNSRFTISVGAIGKNGLHTSYSNPGASLFVSAPGGDYETLANHISANYQGGCIAAGEGTSFACPVVSGVIALMLEANGNLTWRDVQGILATTSRMVTNDPLDVSLTVNGAGLAHSNFYGFGVIDAYKAVTAAKNWTLFGPEKILVGDSGVLNFPILDTAKEAVVDVITLSPPAGGNDFITESAEVLLDVQSFSRGDLQIVLTSPSGTESILTPGKRPENTILDTNQRWKLLTVRSWGESAIGDWKLSIRDVAPGDALPCADYPWYFNASDGNEISCDFFVSQHFCANGTIIAANIGSNLNVLTSLTYDGRTIQGTCAKINPFCAFGFQMRFTSNG